jgi:hypothetical protein
MKPRIDHLQNLAAFHTFNQDFDVAVGQFEALHDVDDSRPEDLIGLGFVDGGVVLGSEEIFLSAASALPGPARSIHGPSRTASS